MLELVQEIIYKVTGKRNITPETDFIKDLDLNSFDIMNIVCAFEDHFGVSVPTRDVWRMHQVKDVIAYINQKLRVQK
jgi:acyl carrier protein